MVKLAVLKEVYELTGKNAFFALDKNNLDKCDPEVLRAIIWIFRRETKPDLKLIEITEFSIDELIEANDKFFR